jgi:DNA-binding NarL/FixJ family response regulator
VLDPGVARDALAESAAPQAQPEGQDPYETLTDREKQVLKLVAEGRSNKEVAETLGISVKTAMSHREHLLEKLGLHGRTELVKFALRHGIIRL